MGSVTLNTTIAVNTSSYVPSGTFHHLIGHSCSQVGSRAFIFGGKRKQSDSFSSDLYVLDLATKTSTRILCAGSIPSPRYEHGSAAFASSSPDGVYLYVFGGRTLNPSSAPSPLYELFITEHIISLFLSGTSPATLPTWKTISPRSFRTNQWPSDRFAHNLVPLSHDYILLCGGLSGQGESLRLLTDSYLYHRHHRSFLPIPRDQSQLLSRAYAGTASLFPSQRSALILGGCRVGEQYEAISFSDAVYVSINGKTPTVIPTLLPIRPQLAPIMRNYLIALPKQASSSVFRFICVGGEERDSVLPYPQLSLLSIPSTRPSYITLEGLYGSVTHGIRTSKEAVLGRERHTLAIIPPSEFPAINMLVIGGRSGSGGNMSCYNLSITCTTKSRLSHSSSDIPSPLGSPNIYETPPRDRLGSSRSQQRFSQVNWGGVSTPIAGHQTNSIPKFPLKSGSCEAQELIDLLHSLMDGGSWVGRELVVPRSQRKRFKNLCLRVFNTAAEVLLKEPNIVEVPSPAYVLGDLHGNMLDLYFLRTELWRRGPSFTAGNFVLLGDYVDRGTNPLEVVAYVIAMKLLHPKQWFVLRGNHECFAQFSDKFTPKSTINVLLQHYSEGETNEIIESLQKLFNSLSLIAVVNSTSGQDSRKVFCCHGGIPRPIRNDWKSTWQKIKSLPKSIDPSSMEASSNTQAEIIDLYTELLWNDVSDYEVSTPNGFDNSDRGPGCYQFGSTAISEFCKHLGFSAIIRGHQATCFGVQLNKTADIPVVTVFSTSRDHFGGISQNQVGTVLVSQTAELQFIAGSPSFPTAEFRSNERKVIVPSTNRIVAGFIGGDLVDGNSQFFEVVLTTLLKLDLKRFNFKSVDTSNIFLPLLDIYSVPDSISKTKLTMCGSILNNLTELLPSATDIVIELNEISLIIQIPNPSIERLTQTADHLRQMLRVDVEPRSLFRVVLYTRESNAEIDDDWASFVRKKVTENIIHQLASDLVLETKNPKFVGVYGNRVEVINS
ncbi:hypothetical protein P9112_011456 [Eukaryota sp. TZLM1-RC]